MRTAFLTVLTFLLLCGSASAGLPVVSVSGGENPTFVDEQGREVLLRGINDNQLADYYAGDPAKPTTTPLTREDFRGMRKLGFNVVRLVTNWSAWAPERGAFSEAYLARVRTAVRQAADEGMSTIVDMHQDAWGKNVFTPAGEVCPPGLGPANGWDGAPAWADRFDGLTTCRASNTRELSAAVGQAFMNFFVDRDGIQTELVKTWGQVAERLAGEPGVIGWDLLNEPHPGFGIGPNQSVLLGRFYDRAITSIRAGERAAAAPTRVAFFEPSVLWSGLGAGDALPPPGFTSDRQIAFAPHLYSESITQDRNVGITAVSVERGFDSAEAAARLYGVPVFSGEWGWFGPPERDGPLFARYQAQEDLRGLGGTYWEWKEACGDPHVSPTARTAGSLNPMRCSDGAQLPQVEGYALGLSRAYPRLIPGRLTGLRSDTATGALRVRGEDPSPAGSCVLEAWLPDRGRGEPVLRGTNVDDVRLTREPGGWTATGCARGSYVLEAGPGSGAAGSGAAREQRCVSRRRFRVSVRVPRRVAVRRASVRVGSRRARRARVSTTRAKRGRARRALVLVDLRGLGVRRVRVSIRVTLRGGRSVSERRVYRTCARRR